MSAASVSPRHGRSKEEELLAEITSQYLNLCPSPQSPENTAAHHSSEDGESDETHAGTVDIGLGEAALGSPVSSSPVIQSVEELGLLRRLIQSTFTEKCLQLDALVRAELSAATPSSTHESDDILTRKDANSGAGEYSSTSASSCPADQNSPRTETNAKTRLHVAVSTAQRYLEVLRALRERTDLACARSLALRTSDTASSLRDSLRSARLSARARSCALRTLSTMREIRDLFQRYDQVLDASDDPDLAAALQFITMIREARASLPSRAAHQGESEEEPTQTQTVIRDLCAECDRRERRLARLLEQLLAATVQLNTPPPSVSQKKPTARGSSSPSSPQTDLLPILTLWRTAQSPAAPASMDPNRSKMARDDSIHHDHDHHHADHKNMSRALPLAQLLPLTARFSSSLLTQFLEGFVPTLNKTLSARVLCARTEMQVRTEEYPDRVEILLVPGAPLPNSTERSGADSAEAPSSSSRRSGERVGGQGQRSRNRRLATVTEIAATLPVSTCSPKAECSLALVQVLCKILFDDAPTRSAFGKVWWPSYANLFIENVLKRVIPEKNLTPQDYQILEESVRHMEADLSALQVLQGENLLTAFVDNMESHFAERKGDMLLSTVRKLLMHNDFATVPIGNSSEASRLQQRLTCSEETPTVTTFGVESDGSSVSQPARDYDDSALSFKHPGGVFGFHQSKVFRNTTLVVDELYRTMSQLCRFSTSCAVMLFERVYACIDLYRILMPLHHTELDSVPQIAGIFYNDCHYVAQHLLVLHKVFSQELSRLCPEVHPASLLDMRSSLQHLGRSTFMKQIEKQQLALQESIDVLEGFTGADDEQRFANLQLALKQVAFKLGILSNVMHEVLPPTLFSEAMGNVLSHCLRLIIDELLTLKDIGEDEGANLRTALLAFGDRVAEVFSRRRATASTAAQQRRGMRSQRLGSTLAKPQAHRNQTHPGDPEIGSSGETERLTSFRTVDRLCIRCDQWIRFHKLVDLLDLPLRRIVEYYMSGELQEFSGAQLRHLITALFCETPLRRSSLATIAD